MIKWEVTSYATQGVYSSSHTLVVMLFCSAQDTFDVLIQDSVLKVLELLLLYILIRFKVRASD